MGRVGLLGRPGAGTCPHLPQRRPEPGSAASGGAEYQRFSSGVPARSGPLWQIWTTGAAAGPVGRAVARLGEVHDVGASAGTRAEGGRRPGGRPVRPRRPRPSAPHVRECAGFQSNAHLPAARSTGNLRVRGAGMGAAPTRTSRRRKPARSRGRGRVAGDDAAGAAGNLRVRGAGARHGEASPPPPGPARLPPRAARAVECTRPGRRRGEHHRP